MSPEFIQLTKWQLLWQGQVEDRVNHIMTKVKSEIGSMRQMLANGVVQNPGLTQLGANGHVGQIPQVAQ